MKSVEIYTTPLCPFCIRAKKLLFEKGVEFTEYDVSSNSDLRQEMLQRASGRTSVPQIFIGDDHIGGCDDLHALDSDGKLDKILK
ncbi:MAG: glutaredoxin 3 [Alphaproteobacteria bacterium]